MSISNPNMNTRITHTVTLASEQKTNLSDTWLPASEPTEAQISYTIALSDAPTINPPVYSYELLVFCYAGLLNNSGSAETVYAKGYKNGTEVSNTNQSINTGNKITVMTRYRDFAVGDTFSLKLWGSTSLQFVGYGMQCTPNRIRPNASNNLYNLSVTLSNCPVFTGLTGYSPSLANGTFVPRHASMDFSYPNSTVTTLNLDYCKVEDYLVRGYYGDYQSNTTIGIAFTSSAYIPYTTNRNRYPSTISYYLPNYDGDKS